MSLARRYSTPVYGLLRQGLESSSLVKLKINVTCLTECFYLLDGRLENLSTLIIHLLTACQPLDGIGSTVSPIHQSSSAEGRHLYHWSFLLEKTSELEIFYFDDIWSDSRLWYCDCSITLSNDSSGRTNVVSASVQDGFSYLRWKSIIWSISSFDETVKEIHILHRDTFSSFWCFNPISIEWRYSTYFDRKKRPADRFICSP